MKAIQHKKLILAFLCVIGLGVSLIAGAFNWLFFIPGALSMVGYIIIDRKFLRCPYCNGFTNLDRLLYAKTHRYHCSHCGERICISDQHDLNS